MNLKDKLTEATMLAIQGKLTESEQKELQYLEKSIEDDKDDLRDLHLDNSDIVELNKTISDKQTRINQLKSKKELTEDKENRYQVIYNSGATQRRKMPNQTKTFTGTREDLMKFLDSIYVDCTLDDDDEVVSFEDWVKVYDDESDLGGSTAVIKITENGKTIYENDYMLENESKSTNKDKNTKSLLESEDVVKTINTVIKKLQDSGDYNNDQINYLNDCKHYSSNINKLSSDEIYYVVTKYPDLITLWTQKDNSIYAYNTILSWLHDTDVTDYLYSKKYNDDLLQTLSFICDYGCRFNSADKNIIYFLLYSGIEDKKQLNELFDQLRFGEITIDQAKEQIRADSISSIKDSPEIAKVLNEICNELNNKIILSDGWEVYDNSVCGTIDDDYTIQISATSDKDNNITYKFNRKSYTDKDIVIKQVIDDVNKYAKNVLNEYGDYPLYLKEIK